MASSNNNNSRNSNNPFQDLFKLFGQQNNAANVVDFGKFSNLHQQTVDTITQAQKAWFDGASKFAKSQTEFFQEQAQTAANVASKALSAQTPEAALDAQTRYAQHYIDAGVQNAQNAAKQLSDTSVKVFDILNKQAVQNMSEFSKTAKKAS